MIHSIEIAFLFISFERSRLEREQIRQILLDLEQLTMCLRAVSQILNKTKDFFESLKYYLRM